MNIFNFQKSINVKPDGVFGPVTLKKAAEYFKLSKEEAIHFFAQCAHETANFKIFIENLNYSKDGLLKTFSKYFDEASAAQYARKPKAIASRVYANRMGNGNEESGDGYKYRGRGAIQLTGKNNYKEFANYVNNQEIMNNPDLVATIYPFESAMFFFDKNKIWDICRKGINDSIILEVTKKINGGTNGFQDRKDKTYQYLYWWG